MSNILTNNINPRSGNLITIGGANDRVSIAGTLSYEDVTNIDSVGIITSKSYIFSGSTGTSGQFILRRDSDGANIGQFRSDLGTNDISIGNGGSGSLILQTGANTERMRIDSAGKVGINTTNPVRTLDVRGDVRVGPSGGQYILLTGSSSTNSILSRDGVTSTSGHPLLFATGTGASAESMRLDTSGRLLIGTSSVTDVNPKLVVEGRGAGTIEPAQVHLRRSEAAASIITDENIGFIVFTDNADKQFGVIACTADGNAGANDYPGRLVFSTTSDGASSPTERMRIRSNGAMTMGDPSSSGNGGWSVFTSDSGSSSQRGRMLFYAKTGTSGVQEIIQIYTGTTEQLRIRADGNVYNVNDVYGALSDRKLKENIVDASSQWDDLKAIQIRNYNFIEGQTQTHLGVVAQEIETVSPGLVDELVDKDEDGNDLGTVTKAVKYSVLYMKAVKALQEAMDRIETLEQRLTDAGL